MLLKDFLNLETERIEKKLNELEMIIIDYPNLIVPPSSIKTQISDKKYDKLMKELHYIIKKNK